MKSISRSLYLIISLVVFDSVSTIAQLNTFDFERGELKIMPNTGVHLIKFIAKKVNRTAMDFELEATLNRTYGSGFMHALVYRQFSSNVYRKYLFDVWEDICKFTAGGAGNVVLKVVNQIFGDYTNIFRECPYAPGYFFIRMKGMPINRLNFGQIFPAGRYRLEVTLADGFQGNSIAIFKFVGSVSDRRVEQF